MFFNFLKSAFTRYSVETKGQVQDLNIYLNLDDEGRRYLLTQGREFIGELTNSNNKNIEKLNRLLNYLILGIGGLSMFLLSKSAGLSNDINFYATGLILWWGLIGIYLIYFVFIGNEKLTVNNKPSALLTESIRGYDFGKPFDVVLECYELINTEIVADNLGELNKKLNVYFLTSASAVIIGTCAIAISFFFL